MAAKTAKPMPESAGSAILGQLSEIDIRSISVGTARTLLQLRFEAPFQDRLTALSEKAQEGTLSPAEDAELDDMIRVGNYVAILQSKARQVLKADCSVENLGQGPP